MGKASSRKRATTHDSSSGRFEPAGPMNDVGIRNYAKTTLAAAEHLIAFYQVVIDEADFQNARNASAISFALAVLADNIHGQLTLRQRSPVENVHAIAQVARGYPKICMVDGVEILPVGGH